MLRIISEGYISFGTLLAESVDDNITKLLTELARQSSFHGILLNKRQHRKSQAMPMTEQALMTDIPQLCSRSVIDLVGFDMTMHAVHSTMVEAGLSPKVCEYQHCFSASMGTTRCLSQT